MANYNFMTHIEKEEQVNQFVRNYLLITLKERTDFTYKVIYAPESLTFKIIIHVTIDGKVCSAGIDAIPESCDGLVLTKAIEEVLRKCREDYIKNTEDYFNRMAYRGRYYDK